MRNTILIGDCIESMRSIEDASIDCCVTSPPYYNLRDYQNDAQIGNEESPDAFVERLCQVFDEVYRILKPTGSCWVNIADSYEKKRLLSIPSRLEIAMADRGWHLRNEIIWSKPNPQPISAKDRYWSNHEKFFWFVKDVKKYYFDRDPMMVPQAEISIRRMFSKNNVSKRKDANAEGKEGFALSSNNQDKHYERMREESGITKDFDYDELVKSGKVPKRPSFTTWDIGATTYKGAHFAVYPPELIRLPILTTCPPKGIVLDPFMGSGTTGEVAKQNGRDYLGCELNPEYAEVANNRLNTTSLEEFL